MAIENRPSSARAGVPDEVKCSFEYSEGNEPIKREYWMDDVRDDKDFSSFLDLISKIISEKCKTRAVLG